MKQLFIIMLAGLLLSACSTSKNLYYWGGYQNETTSYEDCAYLYYKKMTPKSLCNLIVVYERMINNPGGIRQVPPPGICAEYAYLLLQPETATTFLNNAASSQKRLFATDDYGSFFREKGESLLKMELEFYPESAKFIEPITKKLTR